MKIIGLSKCEDLNINIFSKDSFKRAIKIDSIEGENKKVQSLSIYPTVLKISSNNPDEDENEVLSLEILVLFEIKIIFSRDAKTSLEIFFENIIETINIIIPKEITDDELKYMVYNNLILPQINIEELKVSIESKDKLSISFFVTTILKFSNLENMTFLASFRTLEENIYFWDNSESELLQKTFFIDNHIKSIDYKENSGYILSDEKENKIYHLLANEIDEVFIYEDVGEIEKVIRADRDKLIIVANTFHREESIYIYVDGMLDIVTEDIKSNKLVLYNDNYNYLIYAKNSERAIIVMKEISFYKNSISDEDVILNCFGEVKLMRLSKDNRRLLMIIDNRIIIYDLISKSFQEIIYNEAYGAIDDVLFTKNEDIIVIKVNKNNRNNLLLLYLHRKVFRKLTNNSDGIFISSIYIGYDSSYIYLSDNSTYGFNIFRININNLQKEMIIELNAEKVRFL